MKSKLTYGLLLGFITLMVGCSQTPTPQPPKVSQSGTITLSNSSWRLWPDTAATWQHDHLYLPDSFTIAQLPTNAPTTGWQWLNQQNGIEVALPATVEQHYWGKLQTRHYTQSTYYYGGLDTLLKNGSYHGVSWWWKTIQIPETFKNKKITLRVRSARLRAEVYLNQQLVGYHLIGETAFEADLTAAAKPGQPNLLAIRITNPGGRLDWLDYDTLQWGNYTLPATHSFGGLDKGITIRATDPVYIANMHVLNHPDTATAWVQLLLKNTTPHKQIANINLTATPLQQTDTVLTHQLKNIELPPHSQKNITTHVKAQKPIAHWDINHPQRYQMTAELTTNQPNTNPYHDVFTRKFGFRWFNLTGVGNNAYPVFNGKRIRIVSAISCSFWGPNGLWPTHQYACREVASAKALGLNCLQFHRAPGRTEVLNAHDSLGLYRYMEPGGGVLAFSHNPPDQKGKTNYPINTTGPGGQPDNFLQAYQWHKTLRTIADHRSHPSMLMYCIQNETTPSLNNPKIHKLLRQVHQIDPSRVVMLKSGIDTKNQAWMPPYADTIIHDNGKGQSGIWDQHTVGGPGVWQDAHYQNNTNFTHRSNNYPEITIWGEMLGAGSADNHQLLLKQIEQEGGNSYDKADRIQINNAYKRFIKQFNFDSTYPQPQNIYLSTGNKSYDFWGRIIETAKLDNANDWLVISGWESTTIENHSGLVDNRRNLKGNPALMKNRLAPLRPVIKTTTLIAQPGQQIDIDLYLINETGQPATGQAVFKLKLENQPTIQKQFALPIMAPDSFVAPIAPRFSITIPPDAKPGYLHLELQTNGTHQATTTDSLLLLAPDAITQTQQLNVGVQHPNANAILHTLEAYNGVEAQTYQPGQNDVIVCGSTIKTGFNYQTSQTIANTQTPRLYQTQIRSYYPYPFSEINLPIGNINRHPARLVLKTAPIFGTNEPGFSIFIDGKEVTAISTKHQKNNYHIATDYNIPLNTKDNYVQISTQGYGTHLAGAEIISGNQTRRINFGGPTFTDAQGNPWEAYQPPTLLTTEILNEVAQGAGLLLLPEGTAAAMAYAKALDSAGIIKYHNHVGIVRASWMGAWFFAKPHPVLTGLPNTQVPASYYQIASHGGNGILLEPQPNLNVFMGYALDHEPRIGAGAFEVKHGKGTIIMLCLPGVAPAMYAPNQQINTLVAQTLVGNALGYLAQRHLQ